MLFQKGDRKILRSRNGSESGRKGAFSMKTVTSFLIIGLLLLAQSLDAGERGGGVGFALPTQHSSSPAVQRPTVPAAQSNPAQIAPLTGVNIRPGNLAQGSTTRVGQA